MSFGIPQAVLAKGYNPIQTWLQDRADIERQRIAPARLANNNVAPTLAKIGVTENDVLFGKGGDIADHIGNLKYRNLVDRFIPAYEPSNRREKTVIADNIIQLVKDSGGRFLKLVANDEGKIVQWEEASQSLARKKTTHTFRNRKPRNCS